MSSHNHCGECSACCDRLRVSEITWMGDDGKPRDTLCDKYCDGCTIYEERPQMCAKFECLWLKINNTEGRDLPISLRPDSCDVMVTAMFEDGVGHIIMDELRENSFDVMNMTLAQESLVTEIIALMANQTMPTALYVRSYDWDVKRINLTHEQNNNNDSVQQDQE